MGVSVAIVTYHLAETKDDAKQNDSRAEFAKNIKVVLDPCDMLVKFAPSFWWSPGSPLVPLLDIHRSHVTHGRLRTAPAKPGH